MLMTTERHSTPTNHPISSASTPPTPTVRTDQELHQILSDVVEASLLLLHATKRAAALELALRRSRALLPGDLERAEKYLAGFPEDAKSRLAARLARVRP
jgi:hypothetical protein